MSENSEHATNLLNELTSYVYGCTILFGFGLLMLFIHLSLDYFFHN